MMIGIKRLLGTIFAKSPELSEFLLILWIAVTLIGGWKQGIGGYLYRDSKPLLTAMEQYGHLDALYLWNGGSEAMWDFVDISKLKSVTFFQGNVSELKNMDELNRQSEYVLYVVQKDGERIEAVMEEIMQYCPQITECEWIGRYARADIYHIHGK